MIIQCYDVTKSFISLLFERCQISIIRHKSDSVFNRDKERNCMYTKRRHSHLYWFKLESCIDKNCCKKWAGILCKKKTETKKENTFVSFLRSLLLMKFFVPVQLLDLSTLSFAPLGCFHSLGNNGEDTGIIYVIAYTCFHAGKIKFLFCTFFFFFFFFCLFASLQYR